MRFLATMYTDGASVDYSFDAPSEIDANRIAREHADLTGYRLHSVAPSPPFDPDETVYATTPTAPTTPQA